MRSRKWVLVLALSVTVLGLLLYYGWKLGRADELIKNYLLGEIRQVFGEESNIESVRVGFGTIHLRDVNLVLEESPYTIAVDDLRLSYSLSNLLIHNLNPAKMSGNILFNRPRIVIHYVPLGERRSIRPLIEEQILDDTYRENLRELKFLRTVSIVNGEIAIVDSSQQVTVLAREVEGIVSSSAKNKAIIGLQGKLFSSADYNLKLDGDLDLRYGVLEKLVATVENYRLSDRIPLLLPDYMEMTGGIAEGTVSVWEDTSNLKGFNVAGNLRVFDGTIEFDGANLRIEDINMDAEIENWDIYFTNAQQSINGSPVKLSGRIVDIMHPQFDLTLTSDKFAMATFGSAVFAAGDSLLRGPARLNVALTGPPQSPQLRGAISGRELYVENLKVSDMSLALSYADSSLKFDHISGSILNNDVSGDLLVSFSEGDPRLQGALRSTGDVLPYISVYTRSELTACRDSLQLQVNGPLGNLNVNADYFLEVETRNDSVWKMLGTLQYERGTLVAEGSGPGRFWVSAVIDSFASNPRYDISAFDVQQPLCLLWDVPYETRVLHGAQLDLEARGQARDMEVNFETKWRAQRDTPTNLIAGQGGLRFDEGGQALDLEFQLYSNPGEPLNGVMQVRRDAAGFSVQRLQIEDMLRAKLRMDLATEEIEGALQIYDATFARAFASADSLLRGTFGGSFELSGSVASPLVQGEVRLNECYLNERGPYATELQASYRDSVLQLRRLNVLKSGAPLFRAEGFYAPAEARWEFNLASETFRSEELLGAAFGADIGIDGACFVQLAFSGTPEGTSVEGGLEMQNGSLAGFSYDTLRVVLGESSGVGGDNGSDNGESIKVNTIELISENRLAITGSGTLPLRTGQTIDIDLQGSGNLFAYFEDTGSFFRETSSSGTLRAHIGGALTAPQLDEAEWRFSGGNINFGSILRKAEELAGTVRLNRGSRIIEIENVRGRLGGKPVLFRNITENDSTLNAELEPLTLDKLNLSLGVIVVETSEDGVPLNFPGLMELKNFGYFEMQGKTEGSCFCFAGPNDRPVLHGRINLRSFDFGYPFYDNVPEMSPAVKRFLHSIEWDLLVVPGNNVRYVKRIPGALDNVYVYLDLDEEYGGLNFSGQLADDSFLIEGELRSTRGSVEYLDMNFRLERAGVEFDRTSKQPVMYGRAYTTVTDSTGLQSQIYLTLTTIDSTLEQQAVSALVKDHRTRARWDELQFQLSSDNPNIGFTETQVMASMGYTGDNIRQKAVDALGISADNLVFRPLFRPVERTLERGLGLDLVRVSSRFTRNLIEMNLYSHQRYQTQLALLRSTRLTVGKYLADKVYLIYTGQLEAGQDFRYQSPGYGLHHTLGLEYRINPKLLLEMEYDYDGLLLWRKDDKRFMLRHWFPF